MTKTAKSELRACRRAVKAEREREQMYQRAADNAPSEAVRSWNQQRADWAKDRADTYSSWLAANR